MQTIAQRLDKLLQGRSPWKWGKQVGLNDGAMGRLLKGNFPDPVKLVPMMRIENLSLDWLLDGRGTPHPVAAPADEDEAAQWITQHMRGDSGAAILIIFSAHAFTPVLHSLVQVRPKEGEIAPYNYRATTIIGGSNHSTVLVKLLRGYATPTVNSSKGSSVTSVEVSETLRRDICSGQVGNYTLFGDEIHDGLPGGLYANSKPDIGQLKSTAYPGKRSLTMSGVRDEPVTWLDPTQRELHALYTGLGEQDRSAAIRMLRGLQKAAD